MITLSARSATCLGDAPQVAPAAIRPAARSRSRSCTVSVEARAQQAAGEMRAEVAEPDEPEPHHALLPPHQSRPVEHLEVELLAGVGMARRDLLVELDAEAGRRPAGSRSRPARRSAPSGSRRGSRPRSGCSRGSGSSGCRRRAGCWPHPRSGRSRGAARSGRSGPRPCRRSSWPRGCRRPGRAPSAGSRPRRSRARARTRTWSRAARRSRSGSWSARATLAISSGISGGVGSSNHKRVEGLEPPREADRAGRGHLAMGPEQQVAAAADRLAQRAGRSARCAPAPRATAGADRTRSRARPGRT